MARFPGLSCHVNEGNVDTAAAVRHSHAGPAACLQPAAISEQKQMSNDGSLLPGFRVLDLSTSMGALCGKLLADFGMDVVKVEPPGGDDLRREPPFASGHNHAEGSLRFAYLNAGKRGVTLDLKHPTGRDLLLRLVERSDVVVDSHEPGYLEALGVGYGALVERQPKLVLVSISGFGQDGPHRDYVAPDIVTTAMGGLLYISGDPALPPCIPPEQQSYSYTSLYAAYGVMLGLWQRESKGVGVHVDASVQASLALHEHVAFTYSAEGRIVKRTGSQHQHVAPANLFPCKDGYISFFATQRHWPIFLKVWEDHPAELDDPALNLNTDRRAAADWINPLVASFTERYDKEELAVLLQKHGLPALPVNSPGDFIRDAHVQERGFFGEVSHPMLGTFCQPGVPFLVDGQRHGPSPAPMLGQHNSEVLGGELGLSGEELEILAADGAI
jgi:crotonobetainyl-CoA:carnitine CoA-transferase CaiB-like acyl-CoA transferase